MELDHTNALLTVLVDAQPRWSTVGAGFVLQCVGAALLIIWPMLIPQELVPIRHYETILLAAPRTEVLLPPEPPKTRPTFQPPREVPVEPLSVARLVAPPKAVIPPKPQPKPLPADVAPNLNPVFTVAKIEGPKNEPPRPRSPVETGAFSTGSAALPTSRLSAEKVQTGGFGDPNGVVGKGDPSKRANIAQKGQWDLPGGLGYGNGTGGLNDVRGTVTSAGFGNDVAIAPGGKGGKQGLVQSGSFSDATKITEAPKKAAAQSTSPVQPVEILAKPGPVYTEEARNLKLEGEVLLAVVFPASGPLQVIRVIRGLGHGLDESAVNAAQQIRFKPASRGGQPVDFPATVHIVFQLAY